MDVGDVFGRWTVTGEAPDKLVGAKKRPHRQVRCRCACGAEKEVAAASLRRGLSESCGCLALERRTHHGGSKTPEHHAWTSMWQRCTNERHPKYPRYGGRGLAVCERWAAFPAFLEDMGPRPSPQHSIDRTDNDRGYEPENCRWATRAEQQRNTRRNIYLEHEGERLHIAEWSRRTGISEVVINRRVRDGWAVWQALTLQPTPPKRSP